MKCLKGLFAMVTLATQKPMEIAIVGNPGRPLQAITVQVGDADSFGWSTAEIPAMTAFLQRTSLSPNPMAG